MPYEDEVGVCLSISKLCVSLLSFRDVLGEEEVGVRLFVCMGVLCGISCLRFSFLPFLAMIVSRLLRADSFMLAVDGGSLPLLLAGVYAYSHVFSYGLCSFGDLSEL
jgi:hypothetical protein